MQGYVHSTESFGTVDGPGVRFVVFFQGCPMRCLYCHNPDTWQPAQGMVMTTEEILMQYERYKEFLKSGGITATGGEPMLQMDFLTDLFTKAKAKGIHTCLDTSGICFSPENPDACRQLAAVTDLVMLDIKHIDDEKHRRLTGQSNRNILAFAEFLAAEGVPLWIRHVVVPGWTDDAASLEALGHFIGGLKTLKALDVLPYHDMGKAKYEALGMDYPLADVPALAKEDAEAARVQIMKGLKARLLEK
ncbi:MAG: pyruvate formate lyase-activating protein [Ruminococcus sp.]|nr:pyruvate formate lyase-activating protein [Ruminococcus sp.]